MAVYLVSMGSLFLKDQVQNLGVLLGPALSMEKSDFSFGQVCFYYLRKISTYLCPYFDGKPLTTLVHELVISRTGNCNTLYVGLPLKAVWKLQQVKNSVVRLVSGTS